MNPDTNRFEPLHTGETEAQQLARLKREFLGLQEPVLLRPDGSPVPDTWIQFQVGEHVEIKGYTFRVGWVGETAILFEPVGPIVIEGAT